MLGARASSPEDALRARQAALVAKGIAIARGLPGSGMSQAEMLRALDDETLTAALEDESFSPALVNAEIRRRQSAAPPAMRGNPRGAAGPGRVPEAPGMDILRNIAGIAGRRRDDVAAGASAADAGIRDATSGIRSVVGDKLASLRASMPSGISPLTGTSDIEYARRAAQKRIREGGGVQFADAPEPMREAPFAGEELPMPDALQRALPASFAGEEPPMPPALVADVEEVSRDPETGGVIDAGPVAPSALSAINLYREGVNPAVSAAARPFTSHAAAAGLPVAPTPAPRGAASPAAAAAPGATAAPEPTAAQAATADADESQSAYNTASDAARKRITEILDAQKSAGISDKDRWLSLALGGARMAASRNPYFLGAAGEGAAAGLEDYTAKDKLAKDQARAETGQRLQGEQLAETAGDRAERRVNQKQDIKFKHLDRQDRNAARREELDYRYDALAQAAQNAALSLEERRQAAKEALEVRKEIAQLSDSGRRYAADQNLAGRKYTADQNLVRSREAGAKGTHETKWIDYAIDKGLVEDTVDGRRAALSMIRPSDKQDISKTMLTVQSRLFLDMKNDPTDRRTIEEKKQAASELAKHFTGQAQQAGGSEAAPKPAAAPAATGEWGIKKKAE